MPHTDYFLFKVLSQSLIEILAMKLYRGGI